MAQMDPDRTSPSGTNPADLRTVLGSVDHGIEGAGNAQHTTDDPVEREEGHVEPGLAALREDHVLGDEQGSNACDSDSVQIAQPPIHHARADQEQECEEVQGTAHPDRAADAEAGRDAGESCAAVKLEVLERVNDVKAPDPQQAHEGDT